MNKEKQCKTSSSKYDVSEIHANSIATASVALFLRINSIYVPSKGDNATMPQPRQKAEGELQPTVAQ